MKYTINDFINDDLSVNWELVGKIEEFQLMKTTEQNPHWHPEGNVWEHTILTVKNCIQCVNTSSITGKRAKLLICAALFHDIGKVYTTVLNDQSMWTAPRHAYKSSEIIDDLIQGENIIALKALVCNHMRIMYFDITDPNLNSKLKEISCLCELEDLVILKTSDLLSSFSYLVEQDLYYLNTLLTYYKNNNKPTIYLMCGLPGSGKSTYVKQYLSAHNYISRDELRIKHGIIPIGKKGVGNSEQESTITRSVFKLMNICAYNRCSMVIDNTNLTIKIRKQFIDYAKANNYNIDCLVFECKNGIEENYQRRTGEQWKFVLDNMQNKFIYPSITEGFSHITQYLT